MDQRRSRHKSSRNQAIHRRTDKNRHVTVFDHRIVHPDVHTLSDQAVTRRSSSWREISPLSPTDYRYCTLIFMNSAWNPVLYVWRFKEARYHLKRMVCICSQAKRSKFAQENKAYFATYSIHVLTVHSYSSSVSQSNRKESWDYNRNKRTTEQQVEVKI